MHLLVLGASGGVGRCVVAQGIARGHRIRALIRETASRVGLAEDSPLLELAAAEDVLAQGALHAALREVDAVISCLGMRRRSVANPWSALTCAPDFNSAAARRIAAAMGANGVQRVAAISAAGVAESAAGMNLVMRLLVASSSIGVAYRDLAVMERVYADSGLDWCCVRPVTLTDGPKTQNARIVDRFGATMTISRADTAGFLLDWIEGRIASEDRMPQIAR